MVLSIDHSCLLVSSLSFPATYNFCLSSRTPISKDQIVNCFRESVFHSFQLFSSMQAIQPNSPMPGTIHVSVLGFDAHHLSPTSSIISVKISMGKKEFKTLATGDFKFPLTTLRDKLVVTLEDAEGNVISHAVIETREVVEKRVWDENFFLDGGGCVHLKLQFVLSDEERHKISVIRESALKKKQDELFNGTHRIPHRASAGFEVQGGGSDEKGNLSARANDISRVINSHLAESPHQNSVEMPTSGGSMLAKAGISSSNILRADCVNEDEVNHIKKVGPADTGHGSVKKMICAFESNHIQDAKPTAKPPPIKCQTRKTEAGFPLETSSRAHFGIGERTLDDAKRVVDLTCHMHANTGADSHEVEKSYQDVKNQKPEKAVNSEDRRGPVGQVVKIAIMMGFASLVLLTRQRK